MPDRRRDRQKRVRQEAGSNTTPAEPEIKPPEPETPEWRRQTTPIVRRETNNSTGGIAYKEEKQYEKVHIPSVEPPPESKQKYRRREVLSNWSRYDDLPPEEDETIIEGMDYMMGEDFSTLLQQYSGGSSSHMKLKGESLWDDAENNILAAHGLGALRINDIVSAINTLPLHVQCNIPEDQLPKMSLDYYNQLADDNRKVYKPNTELKDFDVNEKILESLKLGDNGVQNFKIDIKVNMPDVNQKILESLKIDEDDPLPPEEEEEETTGNTPVKSAIDVALTLSSAFEPEPEDVDLDELIRERSPEKQETPEPESVKPPSKEASREATPAPAKETTPVRLGPSQKEVIKSRGPSQEKVLPKKPNDQGMDFGLPKFPNPSDQKSNTGFNFGLPKLDSNAPEKSISLKEMAGAHLATVEPPKLVIGDQKKEPEDEQPVLDLDAPEEEPSKPVVLVNKNETEDLEDWLDSILD